MLKVAAYTAGTTVPSARYRVRQLISPLRQRNVQITEYPSRYGSYPPIGRIRRPLWGALALSERTRAALRGRNADVTLLQREMLSRLFTAERLTRRPRVLDVDDAIWLNGRRSAERIARSSDLVICGNEFLRQQFAVWNRNITVIPTAVDVARFVPGSQPPANGALAIGWSGTSSGHRYLRLVEPALRDALRACPEATLRIVSDRAPSLPSLPANRVTFIRWSPENEVSELQHLSVGIMPLEDNEWARGKCSFKMLTYMACGVPVVASNVGMNVDVFSKGFCGLPASNHSEWVEALTTLLRSPDLRMRAGAVGRGIVERDYSTEHVADALAAALCSVAR